MNTKSKANYFSAADIAELEAYKDDFKQLIASAERLIDSYRAWKPQRAFDKARIGELESIKKQHYQSIAEINKEIEQAKTK